MYPSDQDLHELSGEREEEPAEYSLSSLPWPYDIEIYVIQNKIEPRRQVRAAMLEVYEKAFHTGNCAIAAGVLKRIGWKR
jgi:hypothetical protein